MSSADTSWDANLAAAKDAWRRAILQVAPTMDPEVLVSLIVMKRFAAGEMLLREGAVATGMSLILEGAVRMVYYRDGKEHIGDFFLEGDICTNYSSLVSRQPSHFWLIATEPTTVAELPWSAMLAATEASPLEMERLRRIVADGIVLTFAKRIWSSLTDAPEDRYRALLAEHPAWLERFPQYMIASYLGLTPEGLSKLRRRTGLK